MGIGLQIREDPRWTEQRPSIKIAETVFSHRLIDIAGL